VGVIYNKPFFGHGIGRNSGIAFFFCHASIDDYRKGQAVLANLPENHFASIKPGECYEITDLMTIKKVEY